MHGPSQERVTFDETTAAVLAAFADTLVPPGEGFPAPSEVRIVEDFMTRYVEPDESASGRPPGVTVGDVAELVRVLGASFATDGERERVAAVSEFEASDPLVFGKLQMLVYAGYYSRPEVRSAIAGNLDAGRDFRGTPQPHGYADVIEPWDTSALSRRGSFVRTEEVAPVDADKLAALVDEYRAAADRNGGAA